MNLESQDNTHSQHEIFLLEALLFLKGTFKTSFIFGALGLVTAIIDLVVNPQYEATAQIAMTQINKFKEYL
jgi:hypothetical protein